MKKQDSFQHWLCSHRSGVSPQNSDLEMGDTKVHVLIHGTTSLTGDGGRGRDAVMAGLGENSAHFQGRPPSQSL